MIFNKYNFINLIIIFFILINYNIFSQPISPSEVITQTAKITLDALEGKEEYYKENSEELYSLIDSILLPNFDRNYAAYLVLGRYGRTATQEQKARFSIAVYNYIVKRYAFGILEFQSNQLSFYPHQLPSDEDRTTIRGSVKLNEGQSVSVDYDLRLSNSQWRVYDISIDGISYVRNLRSQLGSEIRRDGLDLVIERLEN